MSNIKLCWYAGPPIAKIVHSRILPGVRYGYYTGLNRNTGKPTNILAVDTRDIADQPSIFIPITWEDAVEKYGPEAAMALASTGKVPEPKTPSLNPESTPETGAEAKVDETPKAPIASSADEESGDADTGDETPKTETDADLTSSDETPAVKPKRRRRSKPQENT